MTGAGGHLDLTELCAVGNWWGIFKGGQPFITALRSNSI